MYIANRSVDPVMLFKIVLLQYLYGIPSQRRTIHEKDMNAYRWFRRYTLMMNCHTFRWSATALSIGLPKIELSMSFHGFKGGQEGYLEPEAVILCRIHIKANTDINKKIKNAVLEAARRYASKLMEEVTTDRETH